MLLDIATALKVSTAQVGMNLYPIIVIETHLKLPKYMLERGIDQLKGKGIKVRIVSWALNGAHQLITNC